MSKARDLANIISGSGTLNEAVIPNLAASKITSGTLGADRIPDLAATKITSGTIASARLSLGDSDIPNLATSKITSGTFADARISASSVNAHVDLTSLSASNLTSGTVPSARLSLAESDVPNLSAAKITSGTMDGSRISGGTFGSVNGSSLTSLPSSAPSTSQVASATAGVAINAVGSYALLRKKQDLQAGDTASSGLAFNAADGTGSSNSNYPSGTWRCMGATRNTNNAGQYSTVWLRIS